MSKVEQISGCAGNCRKQHDGMTPCAGSCCDIGKRKANDDLVFASNACRLYVALDGVGGHSGGAEASRIVLKQLRSKIRTMCHSGSGDSGEDVETAIARALKLAALDMIRAANEKPDFRQMSTVFALAFVMDGTLFYTHVGDSRVYLLRHNQLSQLTKDETYVQALVDTGIITSESAQYHPMRNIITNAVSGRFMNHNPVVRKLALREGDTILLTTDGVTDSLLPIELQELLEEHTNPDDASQAIVKLAIEEGSRDNCSCAVIRIDAQNMKKTSKQAAEPQSCRVG